MCLKFLIVLSALLCVYGAYADEPDELFNTADNLANEYFAGHGVDLKTAQEICLKMFEYAYVHNIEIWLEKEGGGSLLVDRHICETDKYGEKATYMAVFFAWSAADKIKSATIKPHSKGEQDAMELAAKTNCKRNSRLDSLRHQGYDTYSAKSVIKCSQTDMRCIVSIPVKKADKTLMYTACCMIEPGAVEEHTVTRTDESGTHTTTTYNGTIGAVSVFWDGILPSVPDLSDFGYDCKPKND